MIQRETEKLGSDGERERERERGGESSNRVKRDLMPNINESFNAN